MSQAKRSSRTWAMSPVHPHAAAVDIGATSHLAAVGPDRDPEPVRSFGAFTADLHRLADWLERRGVRTVAMESTGVYRIPAYEVLEQRGFAVVLADARDAKHVPGRKTDVSDAEWLQRLHEHGLLRASFRPEARIATLRDHLRQRERLLDHAAAHVQHMRKAPTRMNLQLHHVVADITGAGGLRTVRALVGGERDPAVLAALRDHRCRAPEETIRQALAGNDREAHVFAPAQALALHDTYQAKVAACDARIAAVLGQLQAERPAPPAPPPAPRHQTQTPNALAFPARGASRRILGVDLTRIRGLGPCLAPKLVAECGTSPAAWPSAKHFTSWLCLAPSSKISGGKLLSTKTRRSNHRAAALLRLAAVAVGRTETALGAFDRRLSGRVGQAKAVTATARKIAVLFSTAPCATAWPTPIRGRPTTRSDTGSACWPTSDAGRGRSATCCRPRAPPQPSRTFLRNRQIAKELSLDGSDGQAMTEQLRRGLVARTPRATLAGEVEIDEVYVVAGHKGQPAAVAQRGGSDAAADWQLRRAAARWRRTSRPSSA